jgi:hypothetical protein
MWHPAERHGHGTTTVRGNQGGLRLPPQAALRSPRGQPTGTQLALVLLFEVVADYKRLSAVPGAGGAGRR